MGLITDTLDDPLRKLVIMGSCKTWKEWYDRVRDMQVHLEKGTFDDILRRDSGSGVPNAWKGKKEKPAAANQVNAVGGGNARGNDSPSNVTHHAVPRQGQQ